MLKNDLEPLVADGLTIAEIANTYGCHYNTVVKYLKLYGLKTKRVKRCSKCGTKDQKHFEPKRHKECKHCRCTEQKERMKRYKQQLVNYRGGCCELCGYRRCLAALHFHHRDPSQKSFSISSCSRSLENMKKEVDKCILVCANCHEEIHHGVVYIK
jgi:transposase